MVTKEVVEAVVLVKGNDTSPEYKDLARAISENIPYVSAMKVTNPFDALVLLHSSLRKEASISNRVSSLLSKSYVSRTHTFYIEETDGMKLPAGKPPGYIFLKMRGNANAHWLTTYYSELAGVSDCVVVSGGYDVLIQGSGSETAFRRLGKKVENSNGRPYILYNHARGHIDIKRLFTLHVI